MSSPDPSTDNGPTSGVSGSGTFSSFQWIVAWLFLILILTLLNRTKFGHVVIYYTLVVLILFLVLANYKWFAGILAPFRSLSPGLAAATTRTTGGPQSAPSASSRPSTEI